MYWKKILDHKLISIIHTNYIIFQLVIKFVALIFIRGHHQQMQNLQWCLIQCTMREQLGVPHSPANHLHITPVHQAWVSITVLLHPPILVHIYSAFLPRHPKTPLQTMCLVVRVIQVRCQLQAEILVQVWIQIHYQLAQIQESLTWSQAWAQHCQIARVANQEKVRHITIHQWILIILGTIQCLQARVLQHHVGMLHTDFPIIIHLCLALNQILCSPILIRPTNKGLKEGQAPVSATLDSSNEKSDSQTNNNELFGSEIFYASN